MRALLIVMAVVVVIGAVVFMATLSDGGVIPRRATSDPVKPSRTEPNSSGPEEYGPTHLNRGSNPRLPGAIGHGRVPDGH